MSYSTLHAAARKYARFGWAVFPIIPGEKIPATDNGFKDATCDLEQIDAWWTENPEFNIAFEPGQAGLCVIDEDTDKGGCFPEPDASAPNVKTPHGKHFYHAGNVPSGASRIAPNVDHRCQGGYVILPPSVVAGLTYTPANDDAFPVADYDCPELPQWVKDKLRKRTEKRSNVRPASDDNETPENKASIEKFTRYLDNHEIPPEGAGSDDATFRAICVAKDYGLCDERILTMLSERTDFEDWWLEQKLANVETYQQNDEGCDTAQGKWGDFAKKFGAPAPANEDDTEPVDILNLLTPEPMLTRDMLPECIADFAFDEAERMGVDPAMIAIPAIVVAGAVLHDDIRIQPKEHDTRWTESARLWAAVLAPPGSKKTAAQNAAVSPLHGIEAKWRENFKFLHNLYEQNLAEYEEEQKEIARRPELDQPDLLDRFVPEPEEPKLRRILVNDVTIEKLGAILADNPRGVLASFDELAGLIGSFGAYTGSAAKDRSAWLQLWNGGWRNIDRVKGSQSVPNWSAAVVGGIQPDKLHEMAPKLDDDGFLQRFLLFQGHSVPGGQDRMPDSAALSRYETVVRQLATLEPPQPNNAITLAPEGRERWNQLVAMVEYRACDTTALAALRGHLAKLSGLFARLILALHAIECAANADGEFKKLAGVVSAGTIEQAYRLMVRFFIPNAERIYRDLFDGDSVVRRVALAILASGEDEITARTIYRACREYRDNERAWEWQAAMAALVEAGWLEAPDDAAAKQVWHLNPVVPEKFAAVTAAERERRQKAHDLIVKAGKAWEEAYR